MAKRIRLENTEGKWWHCDKLDIYARNGYLATCECTSGWILVTDAEKEAAEQSTTIAGVYKGLMELKEKIFNEKEEIKRIRKKNGADEKY